MINLQDFLNENNNTNIVLHFPAKTINGTGKDILAMYEKDYLAMYRLIDVKNKENYIEIWVK